MIDYARIIDAATWDFIERTSACYPDDTASLAIAQQRKIYDAMCATFHACYPEGIVAQDAHIGGVPVRRYGPAGDGPLVMYMHGGGFVVGGLHSHDDVCAEICAATGLEVVSVDYRLAPEHPHPAAFQDCQTVFDALSGQGLVLAGDSAGGNIAAALSHNNRDAGILGQVLIYPGLGRDIDTASCLRHANAPMLTRDDLVFYRDARGTAAHGDTSAFPLEDSAFSGLPPTVAIAAECDPLADDARLYRDAIQDAGGSAVAIEEPGLVHGFLRARHGVPRAAASFGRITRAIKGLAQGVPVRDLGLG